METQEYKRIFDLEDNHGWYCGLHELILATMRDLLPFQTARILDIGCGTGGLLNQLQPTWPSSWGLDISTHALKYSKKRGISHLFQASVSHLPIVDGYFDAIVCIDVIYHKQIQNDLAVLQECHRVLKPGGILILHTPAFSFLKGAHDCVVHTRERYTRSILHHRVLDTKFHILKISYRNFFLFPFIYFKRLFTSSESDLQPLSHLFNQALLFMLQIENRVIKYSNLPFGSSVFCIAQK